MTTNSPSQLVGQLEEWWTNLSRTEMEIVIPKAIEYGSVDLTVVGQTMATLMGSKRVPDVPGVYVQLGCLFHAQSKVARIISAYHEGSVASDDTIMDARNYLAMLQRAKEMGGWPT